MSITTYTDKQGRTRYRVEVTVGYKLDGKRDRRTKVCSTKREAKAVERGFEIIRQGLGGRSDRVTFKEFVNVYYLPMKRKALSNTTICGYESVIKNHLMPTLANMILPDISRLVIQNLLSSRSSYKVAKNTRDMLRQILGEAVSMDVIKSNPAAGRFKFPKKGTDAKDTATGWVSSLSEQRRITALADNVLRPVLVLGFCFGLRKGEILGLDWSDVDFAARVIRVRQAYVYAKGKAELVPPKTDASCRAVPMTDYAFSQLKAIRGKVERLGPVCVFGTGRMTPHKAKKLVLEFIRGNDVPCFTCLSLRHSFATAAIRSGVNVAHLSKMLGHTNITTTYNRYVRPLQDDLQDAVAVLDAAYRVAN